MEGSVSVIAWKLSWCTAIGLKDRFNNATNHSRPYLFDGLDHDLELLATLGVGLRSRLVFSFKRVLKSLGEISGSGP